MKRILAIDDEPLILQAIQAAFPDADVTMCATAEDGINSFLQATPDVVLLDIRLPDMSGMEAFEKLHRMDAKIPVILMTGYGTAGTAIEAMQRGAFEYILKPLDPDTLIPLIEEAAETSRMTRVPAIVPNHAGHDEPHDATSDLLIGACPAMQEVYRSIGRVAKQDVTVLILGESGTGKEVIARAIYQYSARSQGRFLAINCAAIPENLLESELFGHEKGSFTGADRKRIGKFELCNEGTLFLDEIGDMTPLMQTKILRVLQDQTFERVGGSGTVTSTARLIAATNRDLEKAMEENEFRSDLFYRLKVYTIKLPPLRERGDDIQLLANHFLMRYANDMGKEITGFAPEAMQQLTRHPWPGNVRELQSVIKHALLESTGPVIVPAFLPGYLEGATTTPTATQNSTQAGINFAALTRESLQDGQYDILATPMNMAEREILTEVLNHTDGNLTQAAKRLGIARATLRSRMDTLGMSVEHNATIEQPSKF